MNRETPAIWPGADGTPVSCQEKLAVLNENHLELRHVMQDAFEDALLMGVDETFLRSLLANLVAELVPVRGRR